MDKYYVVFSNSDQPIWWMKFLADGFHHCWVAKSQMVGGTELLIFIENMYTHASVDLTYYGPEELTDLGTVVEINLTPLGEFTWEPLTCVTWVKKILGIAKQTIQTPKQLYKHLLSIGGKEWDK